MVRAAPSLEFDTSDVVAHIFYAVGNTDQVTVTSVAGELQGTLAYPDAEGITIVVHSPLPALPTGSPLCVEYVGPGDTYRFYTEVLTVRDGQILATMPYAVECSDRRLTQRIQLPEEAGFRIRLLDLARPDPVPVQDISVGGVSFVDPTDAACQIGRVLRAELLLPGETPIACALEVRHLSLRRGRLRVGARFAAVSLRDRARLARTLLRWIGRPAPAEPAAPSSKNGDAR